MPTYAYACTACGHRFEAHQSFSDAALTECPECSGRLRKLFNSVGIVFKGSGFYRTDSRGSATAESSGSKESGKDGGKTKPATSKEPAAAGSSSSSASSTAA